MSQVASQGEELLNNLGQNVRRLRLSMGMTLQQLADRSGLSRRTLTMVEQGQANPSIGSIARLADALEIDFVGLVGQVPSGELRVISPDRFATLWKGPRGSAARLAVSARPPSPVEVWDWRLAPGVTYTAEADPPGTEELILVVSGCLEIEVASGRHTVPAGHAVHLPSDQPYAYRTSKACEARFVRAVVPSRSMPRRKAS